MYISNDILGSSLLSNIVYKNDNSEPVMIQAMMLQPSIKAEVIEWTKDNNMEIVVLIHFDEISDKPISVKLEEFTYSEWHKHNRILLRFDTMEDHNLFKLTWG